LIRSRFQPARFRCRRRGFGPSRRAATATRAKDPRSSPPGSRRISLARSAWVSRPPATLRLASACALGRPARLRAGRGPAPSRGARDRIRRLRGGASRRLPGRPARAPGRDPALPVSRGARLPGADPNGGRARVHRPRPVRDVSRGRTLMPPRRGRLSPGVAGSPPAHRLGHRSKSAGELPPVL
jgi:hypothetical protein